MTKLLRAAGADLKVSGPDDNWSQIVVVFAERGLFRNARVLTFGHDADHYDSLDWPKQVAGMQGYFSHFPDSAAKADVMRLIGSFRFALSVPQRDLDIDDTDKWPALVYAVTGNLVPRTLLTQADSWDSFDSR